MTIRFFEYSKCSTCQKARKWLEARKIAIEIIPIVDQPPSKAELLKWMKSSGIDPKKFFNTSGQVYREQKMGEKIKNMTLEQMSDALSQNGKLIKRPLLIKNDTVLVGFDEKAYQKGLVSKAV